MMRKAEAPMDAGLEAARRTIREERELVELLPDIENRLIRCFPAECDVDTAAFSQLLMDIVRHAWRPPPDRALSLVIATIGHPCLLDMLASITPATGEVLVSFNRAARQFCSPADAVACESTEREVLTRYRFGHVGGDPSAPFAPCNQTFQQAIPLVTGKWVMLSHDDVLHPPNFDLRAVLSRAMGWLEDRCYVIDGKQVAGIIWPAHNQEGDVTFPQLPTPTLCHAFSPVANIIRADVLRSLGPIDTADGIWYDAWIEAELRLRNYWMLYLPLPPIEHLVGRSFKLTKHADLRADPKWNRFDDNWHRVYSAKLMRVDPTTFPVQVPDFCAG